MTDDLNRQDATDSKRKLPDGWRSVRLREVCERIDYGFTASADFALSEPRFLRISDIQHGNVDWGRVPGCRISAREQEENRLADGDIVFARTGGTTGKSFLIRNPPPAVFASYLIRLRLKKGVDTGFVYSFFQSDSYWQQVRSKARGGAQPNVNAALLSALEFPLPPLPQQQRIAAILNEQMAAVEQARAATQAQLDDAKYLAAAYLRAVFADAEANSWPKHRFDQVAVLQRGFDLPFQNRVPGPYPVVTSGGQAGSHAEFKAGGPGVVTGRSGSVGRVHFVKEDYWPHNTALFVRDFLGNEPRYVFYLLQWINVKQVSSGTGVPTLDRKQVHKLIVPHPSVLDQKRIAAVLNMQIAVVEKLQAALEAQLAEINALPAALLRRAFSGEL